MMGDIAEQETPKALFFSICIPIYNTEKLLPECLDSLLEQNFDPCEYEIICVNDGSPDNSASVLAEYSGKHSEIKVITKENGGLASARYAGYKAARGQYVWFVDSDDFVSPDSLNTIKKSLTESCFPDRLNFMYYKLMWEGTETRQEILGSSADIKTYPNETTIWNSVYKREFLERHRIMETYIEKNLSFGEDTLFIFLSKIYEKTVVRISVPLIFYRKNPKSMTNQTSLQKEQKRARDFVALNSVMKAASENYDASVFNCQESFIAETLMNRIWVMMELLAVLPFSSRRRAVKHAKQEGLFPYQIPEAYSLTEEDTLRRAYGHTKTEKWLNCHSHTRAGFAMMCVYYTPIRIKTALKRLLVK